MTQFSVDPAMISDGSARKTENPRIALWLAILIVTFTPMAFVALMLEGSYTPEQRISLYLQSGNFP